MGLKSVINYHSIQFWCSENKHLLHCNKKCYTFPLTKASHKASHEQSEFHASFANAK